MKHNFVISRNFLIFILLVTTIVGGKNMSDWLLTLLLIAYSLLATVKVFFQSKYTKKYTKNTQDTLLFWVAVFIILALIYLVLMLIFQTFNLVAFLFGLAMGACVFCFQLTYTLAFKEGPVSLTVFFCSLSNCLMPLYSLIRFNASFTVFQIIALGFLVLCLIFNIKKDNSAKINKKWVIFIVLTILANIGFNIIQTEFGKVEESSNNFCFIFSEYSVAALLSIGAVLISNLVNKKPTITINKDYCLSSIGTAIPLCGCAFILLYSVTNSSSPIIFPMISGLCLVFSIVLGIVVYKEKFTKYQWISLCCGLIAIVLANIK